jgi:hypothetical protein
MISLMTLALMVLLVATTRRSIRPTPRKPGQKGDTLILGRGVKLGPAMRDPVKPGVVSYRLMQDKKLPSRSQLALRRMVRPLGRASSWVYRQVVRPKPGVTPVEERRRRSAQSVELQNFLDARNQEIARRKSERDSNRGPDETLH